MNIKYLIIDDEPLAINVIKHYMESFENYELASTFDNALDALNFIKTNPVDLVFLDINMPVLDGLSFIKSLETKPLIIITSAHKEFALESYELDVLDYLLKPFDLSRFIKALNKAEKEFTSRKALFYDQNERPYLFIKIDKKKMKKIYLDDLLVIECLKDYLKIITSTKKYIIHQTLASFTEQLPSDKFIRIHRSFTVSVDKIDTLEGNSIEVGGVRYVIGRTYIKEVKDRILNHSHIKHS
jgi:DNA-binding LytR/AlgR family response regulator